MEIIQYGEHALLVQFPQKIALEIHNKVKAVSDFVRNLEGVRYYIPAYCSLTIVFDPILTSFTLLKEKIQQININEEKVNTSAKHFKIPVCYEEEFGPDIQEVGEFTNLSTQEVMKLHTATTYNVFMMGFIPGFPYLGKLPDRLACKRKSNPRKHVEIGSVGLAGYQTGIYPAKAPGGWQLIGRTPVPLFQAKDDNPFLTKMGDKVTFYSISKEEYHAIEKKFEIEELKGSDFYA